MRNYDLKRKVISFLLCFCILFSLMEPLGVYAEDTETVTVTVNYVYESNQAMVSQPYSAQIAKGAEFKKTIAAPKLLNYSVPVDKVVGLGSGISYSEDTDGNGTIVFELAEVTEDITVTLYYVAGTAKYKVEHYYQKLEDDSYAEPVVVELTGDIDAYTEAVMKNKSGFVCTGVQQHIIASDNTTTVEIYYDREYYTVVFDVNGGINGPSPIYAKYETTFDTTKLTIPTRAGYEFAGWSPDIEGVVSITQDITYTAQWEAITDGADYTIVIWGQNADDDEYSYMSSHAAFGKPGDSVTWNEGTLICETNHVHDADCYNLICNTTAHSHAESGCTITCGIAEHNHVESNCETEVTCGQIEHLEHTSECLTCEYADHEHTAACYINMNLRGDAETCGFDHSTSAVEGATHTHSRVLGYRRTCVYHNGQWYQYGTTLNSKTCATGGHTHSNTCYKDLLHTHTDSCRTYTCGKEEHAHVVACWSCNAEEHVHTAYNIENGCWELVCNINSHGDSEHINECYMGSLYPDKSLWQYSDSDTVTIDASGNTVLNVYFNRTEFTLQFRKSNSSSNDYGTITTRWGQNIEEEFDEVCKLAGYQSWSENRNASDPWTNYIAIMPAANKTYYSYTGSGNNVWTMTYYTETFAEGQYEKAFEVKLYRSGYTKVSEEEFLELKGFNFNAGISTEVGERTDGAKFYYDRNRYNLEFYSSSYSTPDQVETPMYQEALTSYGSYVPKNPPEGQFEPDAIFVGWYLNPECTGEEFDFNSHIMPANNIALYAKWVNGLYTVETYMDNTLTTYFTYDGYNGKQENIEKYTLAKALTQNPTKEKEVFVGWFYKDADGNEQPFSFTMPITQNYKLYPKFSAKKMVDYTVHYYLKKANGTLTDTRVASDKKASAMIGSSVTEKAKMGTDLDLVAEGTYNNYFPDKTSTSVTLNQENMEIIFYYTEAKNVLYTVKYVDSEGKEIAPSVNKTTSYSMVTETYQQIDGYTPRQFSITEELVANPGEGENVITFVYDKADTSLSVTKKGGSGENFVFTIKGTEDATSGIELTFTVASDETVIINDLPLGAYTITEDTAWAWRYSCTPEEQSVTLVGDAAQNQVTFTNTVVKEQWLGGEDYAHNWYGNSTN